MCRTRFTFISAVGRPYQKPSRLCGITDHVVSMLYTTNWFSSQSPRSAHLTVYTEDYPIAPCGRSVPLCSNAADVYHVARSTRVETTPINSCKCCCVKALYGKRTKPPPLTPVIKDHMNQEVQPRSMKKGTVPNGPCTEIAL